MDLTSLGALLTLPLAAQLHFTKPIISDEDAERNYQPRYLALATGDLEQWKRAAADGKSQYRWPVNLKSIGHTHASYQRYGSLSGAYFHHGLDIRADAGSPVIASAGGVVVNIENYEPGIAAYWEVAILDDAGFLWQYHHVDRDSIPKEIFTAYKNKTPIAPGTKLGEVFYWGVVTFGERYHHIHLNVLGKNKEYLSPFDFLEPLPDKAAPLIKEVTLIQNGDQVEGSHVSGNYSVAVQVDDLILSDVFVVPPDEIAVSIDGLKAYTVWKFDNLPGGADKTKYVNEYYVHRMACGDYECRRPVIDLGFSKTPHQIFPQDRGPHHIEIIARDYAGNEASRRFAWDVD